MAVCGKCANPVGQSGRNHSCSVCGTVYHPKCVSVDADGKWACLNCSCPEPTLRDVLTAIKQQGTLIKSVETNLGTEISACKEQLTEVSATLSSVVTDVDSLKLQNCALAEKVSELEQRVADAEQYSRVNDIDIHGIPYRPGENVSAILASLGRALGLPITPELVDVAHRVGPPSSPRRGILVRFLRKTDKEAVIKARKVKRDLKVGALDHFSDLPRPVAEAIVFVNESLSPARRALLNAAREQKSKGKLSDVWVAGGKVYAKKTADGDKVHIRDRTHLTAVASQ